MVVVTAKEITEEDRRRLNGAVERIVRKGAYSRKELLRVVRELVAADAPPSRVMEARKSGNRR